jgi:hypothetical protein
MHSSSTTTTCININIHKLQSSESLAEYEFRSRIVNLPGKTRIVDVFAAVLLPPGMPIFWNPLLTILSGSQMLVQDDRRLILFFSITPCSLSAKHTIMLNMVNFRTPTKLDIDDSETKIVLTS